MGSKADVRQNSQEMGHLKAEVINDNYVSSYFMFSQVRTRCQSVLEIPYIETSHVVTL